MMLPFLRKRVAGIAQGFGDDRGPCAAIRSMIGLSRKRLGIRPAGVIVAQYLAPNEGIRIAADHAVA
jgi:hypothetical protein